MSAGLGLVASFAASWALLRLIDASMAFRIPLIILATLALFSAAGTAQVLFGVPSEALDALFLLVALLGARARNPARPKPELGTETPHWKIAFAIAAILAAACTVEHLWRYPDGGADAFIIWNLRARWLFRAKGSFASAFSPDILFWTHQDYPLMVPGAVARGFALIGGESSAVPAILALVFAASAVAIVVRAAPKKARWLAGLALVTTPNLVILTATEQADIPLAAFLVAAVAMVLATKPGDYRALAAAGAFASMCVWTKNEGILFFLLVFVAVLVTERQWKAAGAFLAGAAPFLMLLGDFKLRWAPANDLVKSGLGAALHRVPDPSRWWMLIKLTLRHLVLFQVWGLHLIGLLAFLVLFRRNSNQMTRWTACDYVPVAALGALALVWLGQPYEIGFMLQVTFDRLLMQLWPAIILLAASRAANRDSSTAAACKHASDH
jgi:hypothetical protein